MQQALEVFQLDTLGADERIFPWEDSDYPLGNLYAMLRFYADKFCQISWIFGQMHTVLKGAPGTPTENSYSVVGRALQDLETHCKSLSLDASVAQIERIRLIISHSDSLDLLGLARNITELHNRVIDELRAKTILLVPSTKKDFLNSVDSFGEKVLEAYPSSRIDIEEAGKCLAYGRNVSGVFHLMRVMEYGLRSLSKNLQVVGSTPSWESILKKCDVELAKPIKDRDLVWKEHDTFFSEATANLRSVKNAWRNPTMHIESKYTDEEARDIFFAVRGFIRHLAGKLSE